MRMWGMIVVVVVCLVFAGAGYVLGQLVECFPGCAELNAEYWTFPTQPWFNCRVFTEPHCTRSDYKKVANPKPYAHCVPMAGDEARMTVLKCPCTERCNNVIPGDSTREMTPPPTHRDCEFIMDARRYECL